MTRRFGRALVTGGAGFVGSHLCERLLEAGNEVVAADNFATAHAANVEHLLHQPGFRLISRDVTAPMATPGRFDVVFHLASAASPRDFLRLPSKPCEPVPTAPSTPSTSPSATPPGSCWPRPARSTAIRKNTPSGRTTGAT